MRTRDVASIIAFAIYVALGIGLAWGVRFATGSAELANFCSLVYSVVGILLWLRVSDALEHWLNNLRRD